MTSPRPPKRDIRDLYRPAPELGPEELARLEEEYQFPEGPYIHVAEYIPVQRWGDVWPFMKMSMRIYQHARTCPGFMAGGIRAKWWRRQFWSYTVWRDRETMQNFVHTAPHAEAIPMLLQVADAGACYTEWSSSSPPDWNEAMERLRHPTRYFVPPGPY